MASLSYELTLDRPLKSSGVRAGEGAENVLVLKMQPKIRSSIRKGQHEHEGQADRGTL